MRSICKKGSVTLVAVLALCVVASASASAAQWYVGGKALSGSAALSSSIKVEETIEISSSEAGFTIKCSAAEQFRGEMEITAPTTLSIPISFELHGCKVTYPSEKCLVSDGEEDGTMVLSPDETKLSLGTAPEDSGTFGAVKGKLMSEEFGITGNCILSETFGLFLRGTVPVKLPTGQTESTEQEVVFSKGTELTISGVPAYLTGKVKLKLASGAKWSLR